MKLIVPLNLGYVQDRYSLSGAYLRLLTDYVLPNMLARYALDERVEEVELLTEVDPGNLESISSKILVTKCDIAKDLSANEVAAQIIKVRHSESRIIVQCNPLFPFISINSLHLGYEAVASGRVASAVGSFAQKSSVTDDLLALEHDLGIFSVYDIETFRTTGQRVSPPFSEIGLQAVELIGLRNPKDIDLFNLIVNSGFSL